MSFRHPRDLCLWNIISGLERMFTKSSIQTRSSSKRVGRTHTSQHRARKSKRRPKPQWLREAAILEADNNAEARSEEDLNSVVDEAAASSEAEISKGGEEDHLVPAMPQDIWAAEVVLVA